MSFVGNFKTQIKSLLYQLVPPPYQEYQSFSQAGEDGILKYVFHQLAITAPTYLDIGTNHPYHGNNTFVFYKTGSRGVCVEANTLLIPLIKKHRPQDICLNMGIGLEDSEMKFFVFEASGLSTFSQADALQRQASHKLAEIVKVQVTTINAVIEKYFGGQPPNLISLDVEGLDSAILRTLDFTKYRPEVICTETVKFSTKKPQEKESDVIPFMLDNDYFIFGDTFINTIFVDKHKWLLDKWNCNWTILLQTDGRFAHRKD